MDITFEKRQRVDLSFHWDDLPERLPFHIFHHDEPLPLGLYDVVNRAEVGMVQGRRGLGLLQEAGPFRLLG